MVSVLRPSQRILHIPAIGVSTSRRAVSAANWWAVAGKTCLAAYDPENAVDLAASYINLDNPGTRNATPGVTPPALLNGWSMASASDIYLFDMLLASDQSQTLIYRFSNTSYSTASAAVGSGIAWAEFSLTPRHYDVMVFFNAGGASTVAGGPASGVLAVSGSKGYLNGAEIKTGISGGYLGTKPLYVFGSRTDRIAQLVIYSDTLTAGEVATVSAAMAAL